MTREEHDRRIEELEQQVRDIARRLEGVEHSPQPVIDPGERLAIARNKAGLTQHQLAQKSGVSPNSIINFENGKTHPRLKTIMALADALNMHHSHFVGGSDA